MNQELITTTSALEKRQEIQAIVNVSLGIEAEANALSIESNDDYDFGMSQRAVAKKALQSLEAERKKATDPLNGVIKTIRGWFQPVETRLNTAVGIYDRKTIEWREKQERIRAEAEAAARRDQERLERKAEEARRKAAEEDAELRRQADAASAAGREAEAERLRHLAESMVAKAEETADKLTEQAINVPMPEELPKSSGGHGRVVWEAECTCLMTLVKAVADGKAPASLLEFSESNAKKFAAATEGKASVPGVLFKKRSINVSKQT